MSINFRPLSKYDTNFMKVIDLYKKAFPGAQRIPTWILCYKLRKGKPGFSIIYSEDTWIGLIYINEYKDIVFIQFLAIAESYRSGGYGSQVMDSMKHIHSGKRIILNIEELDKQAENHHQREKRKAFYEKNGFSPAGYIIQEANERHEMLIFGGSISKVEIDSIYRNLLGNLIGFIWRPKIIKI